MTRDPAEFDAWSDGFAATWVRANPQLATRTQYFAGRAQAELDRELALAHTYGMTYGERAAQAQAALARRGLDELRSFDPNALSAVAQTSRAIVEWSLRDAAANAEFAPQRFVFSQLIGLQVALVSFLTAGHPLRNASDAGNYVARLARVAACLDEGIAEAASAARAGVIPPVFILERTIEQIDGLTRPAAAENVLVTTLVERLRELPDVPAPQADALAVAAADEVRASILPAFARVRELLVEQLPRATDAAGAWALPRGEEYYARALASNGGTSLSADEVHALGVQSRRRLGAARARPQRRLADRRRPAR